MTLQAIILTQAQSCLFSMKQITDPYSISNPENKQFTITVILPPKIYPYYHQFNLQNNEYFYYALLVNIPVQFQETLVMES